MADTAPAGLDRLAVPEKVRQDLADFLSHLVELYRDDLVSVTVFGSAVSGGYVEERSDVNLLVIYSDLNIADLNAVTRLAQSWLKKRRFVPRFLSMRNLTASARFFQIDYLEMRDAYVVAFGRDVLAALPVSRPDMHWQLSHEVKRMRMRIKQQFWRAAGDSPLMQRVLVARFSSLMHLTRALLFLEEKPAPATISGIVDVAVADIGIDKEFAHRMLDLKAGKTKLPADGFADAFTRLMDTIRLVDERIDKLAV